MESLGALLWDAARRAPENVAIVEGRRTVTYGELEGLAVTICRRLAALGIGRGDIVAVYSEKSVDSIAAIHGVLRAGAAYLPLDPNGGNDRVRRILEDAKVACLIASPALRSGAENLAAPLSVPVLELDRNQPPGECARSAVGASGEDLAYVLYTSGSTGAPKGVMVSHRAALAFVRWATSAVGVLPSDRLSSHAPLFFDLSIFDVFGAAAVGATVVLVPSALTMFPVRLGDWIAKEMISVWYSVPTVLAYLTQRGRLDARPLPHLRVAMFAGEPFAPAHLRQAMLLLPQVRFFNLFGPTETNVCLSHEIVVPPEDDTTPIPIGRPVMGTEVLIIDRDGRLAPRGHVGELLVRGPSVMTGYLNNETATAAALIPHPSGEDAAGAFYRTGDFVSEDASGTFHFHGRRDEQIKTAGHRIELGEIHAVICENASVSDCAVVAVNDPKIGVSTSAFVVSADGAEQLSTWLRDRLPHYMIPRQIQCVPVIPRTPSGKVDRQRLLSEVE